MIYTRLLRAMLRARYGEPPETPSGEGAGLVLMADGVGGLDLCGTALRYVAAAEGLPHEVRILNWGHGFGRWHADLTNVPNHEAKSAVIAAELAVLREQRAGAPSFLVGKSGGTGLVVRALEALPARSVEAVVLISPALSPEYDLSAALRAVQREMVVFWSPLDLVVLGLGTRIFGTVDRVNSVSAGLVGFRPPGGSGAAAPPEYARLRQVRWQPEMASTGYFGGHVGPDSPAFLRKYVLPLLTVGGASNADSSTGSSPRPNAPIT